MECNVGGVDRVVRAGLGTALVSAGLASSMDGMWRAALIGAGSIALITAATQYCPLNAAAGIDTCARAGES
ncbi:DUF2892 domain-containing protein [Microvirga sp. GCM10011540]|uniref:YgaP family membrane protein n=1 Tax=Microvirga sp. GCM10011540 TaxID=3317338 RepID=UPI00360D74CC